MVLALLVAQQPRRKLPGRCGQSGACRKARGIPAAWQSIPARRGRGRRHNACTSGGFRENFGPQRSYSFRQYLLLATNFNCCVTRITSDPMEMKLVSLELLFRNTLLVSDCTLFFQKLLAITDPAHVVFVGLLHKKMRPNCRCKHGKSAITATRICRKSFRGVLSPSIYFWSFYAKGPALPEARSAKEGRSCHVHL